MDILTRNFAIRFKTLVTICLCAFLPAAQSPANDVVNYGYRVVNVYPHDSNAFTQGLFFRDGVLYESTGLRGSSSIRKVSLTTGLVLQKRNLANKYFGEGIVDWNDQLIWVTWKSQTGFVFGFDDFVQQRTFDYAGEGWGLTRDASHIIMSDGTATLRFLDPESFEERKRLNVVLEGREVSGLNELEWIEGSLFSNIWQTDWIVQIDPVSGSVIGLIDLAGILPVTDRKAGHTDVLNGIAYDAETKRMFVTGKHWPSLFEIVLVEKTRNSGH